jgi:dTDP-4-dehydrorhamnose reductase
MRILILGGNGMIGHKMYQVLSNVYADTWVLFRKKLDQINASEIFNKNKCIDNFDLIQFDKLHSLLNQLKPDIIINAAGITIRRGVNEILYKSIIINAALPHFLDNWAKINKKRLIHFSTDCVFSGKDGFYSEKSIPDADDIYGKTKAMGEINSTNSLTLRGSMIGRELENKTELLEWFLNQTNELTGGTAASADHSNSLNFIKDPSGKLHLVTYVQFQGTGRRQLRVYTSLLGTPASGNSPQTASNLSTQAWPYLQSPANNP